MDVVVDVRAISSSVQEVFPSCELPSRFISPNNRHCSALCFINCTYVGTKDSNRVTPNSDKRQSQ